MPNFNEAKHSHIFCAFSLKYELKSWNVVQLKSNDTMNDHDSVTQN